MCVFDDARYTAKTIARDQRNERIAKAKIHSENIIDVHKTKSFETEYSVHINDCYKAIKAMTSPSNYIVTYAVDWMRNNNIEHYFSPFEVEWSLRGFEICG